MIEKEVMEEIKVYVSCAITHSSDEYKRDIAQFIHELKKIPGVIHLEFCSPMIHPHQQPLTPKEIYRNDIIDCVEQADLIIAETSVPTTGLGIEIGVILGRKTPTLMYAKEGAVVTNLVLGIPFYNPNTSFTRYKASLIEMMPGIQSYITYLQNVKRTQAQLKK